MTPFEEDLKRALERQEPSVDFTARVLARVASQAVPARATQGWQWAAAAAAALVMLGGGVFYQRHEREVQGQAAKQKLLMALHIAGTKLQQTQDRVFEAGESQ